MAFPRRPAYPHAFNDCAACRARDADIAERYSAVDGGQILLCQICAGALLANLVHDYVVTVRHVER